MAAEGLALPLTDSTDKSKNLLDKVNESAATYSWAFMKAQLKPDENQRSTPAQIIFSHISGLSLELLHGSGYHKPHFVSVRLHVSPCKLSWENSVLQLPKPKYFPTSHRLPEAWAALQPLGHRNTEMCKAEGMLIQATGAHSFRSCSWV